MTEIRYQAHRTNVDERGEVIGPDKFDSTFVEDWQLCACKRFAEIFRP